MKWVKWLLILAVLGGAGWAGWYYWQKPRNKQPDYRTAEVARGDLTQSVTASGQLNPVLNVQVGSQISGMIQRLYADYNSTVTQNQVIAELDASTYRAVVHQAEADLANAKAGLELAQVNAKRSAELRKTELIAISEHDKNIADLHQAEAQVLLRDAAVEKAKVDLNRCTIYAPTNGIVISRNVDVGQTVAASLSAPTIFVIANDLSKMQIDALVSEADIGGVEVGQDVNFTVDAFPSRNFSGKVSQIRNAATTNQNVVTYDTVITVENADLKLRPGMTANVSIVIAEREDVLKIPNAALRFKPPDADEGKGKRRPSTGTNEVAAAQGERAAMRGGGGWGRDRAGGSGAQGFAGGPPGGGPPGGGGPGGWGGQGSGGAGRMRRELSNSRTVYLKETSSTQTNSMALKPARVKIGISDGTFTEITDGLKEGDVVVTGQNITQPPPMMGSPNPFGGGGGGMRRF